MLSNLTIKIHFDNDNMTLSKHDHQCYLALEMWRLVAFF